MVQKTSPAAARGRPRSFDTDDVLARARDTFFTVAAPAQHAASAGNAHVVLAVVGALIGSISLTGSVIAWAKLDGRMDRRYTFACAADGQGQIVTASIDPARGASRQLAAGR